MNMNNPVNFSPATWETSFFPHRCSQCKRWIKRKTAYVDIYDYGNPIYYPEGKCLRFCDPYCAQVYVDAVKAKQKVRKMDTKMLNDIIFGGEDGK